MPKIGVDLSEETTATLRDFTLKRYGKFRGQSLVVEEALKEFFANKAEKGNAEGFPSAV